MYSLNTHIDLIKFDEEQNQSNINDLPIKPIVAVLSNMGTGKTKALKRLIASRNTKDERMLIITFSKKLANKYKEDLPEFSNYLQLESYKYG